MTLLGGALASPGPAASKRRGGGAYGARSGIDLSLRPLAWLGRAIKIAVLPPKELTPGEPIVRSRPAARVTTQPVCARARGPGVARSLAGALRCAPRSNALNSGLKSPQRLGHAL